MPLWTGNKNAYLVLATSCSQTRLVFLQETSCLHTVSRMHLERTDIKSGSLSALIRSLALSVMRNAPSKVLMPLIDCLREGKFQRKNRSESQLGTHFLFEVWSLFKNRWKNRLYWRFSRARNTPFSQPIWNPALTRQFKQFKSHFTVQRRRTWGLRSPIDEDFHKTSKLSRILVKSYQVLYVLINILIVDIN